MSLNGFPNFSTKVAAKNPFALPRRIQFLADFQ